MRSLFTFDAQKTRGRRAFAYAYTMLSNKDSIVTAGEGGDDIGDDQQEVTHAHEKKHGNWTRQRQVVPSSSA